MVMLARRPPLGLKKELAGSPFLSSSFFFSCFNSSFSFNNWLDMSTRYRLATLNEKLTTLERSLEFIEAKVGNFRSQSQYVLPLSPSSVNVVASHHQVTKSTEE